MEVFINHRFMITPKAFLRSIARRWALQYSSVSESLLYSCDTRYLLRTFSTSLPFFTLVNPFTLHPLSSILYFNSIRAQRGSNTCLAASIPLFSLHRPGILAYQGMAWSTRRHIALHHFNPSLQRRALYISVWPHPYHYS